MILLLDQDGPLADFDAHFHARCTAEGWTLDVDHPRRSVHRLMTDHLPHRYERDAARRMVDTDPEWFRELPVTEGAREGIEALREAGVELWVCTKPLEANPRCRDAKGAWLREHFPELEDRLIIAPDKSLIRGDVLLDDAPKLSWLPRAEWVPVVFTTSFNVTGSEWADLDHWTWGDPLEDLLRR